MEELTAPFLLTAHPDLRHFHEQKAEQYVALLADVSQPPPISAGLLLRLTAASRERACARSRVDLLSAAIPVSPISSVLANPGSRCTLRSPSLSRLERGL
jgi:hypothetical protein